MSLESIEIETGELCKKEKRLKFFTATATAATRGAQLENIKIPLLGKEGKLHKTGLIELALTCGTPTHTRRPAKEFNSKDDPKGTHT